MFNNSAWMASRCAENSVAEEGFQYPLFKQTLEKVKWKNMAPHIHFLENQCPLKFWVTTNSIQSPIKAYGRAFFLRSLLLSFFCGCFFFFSSFSPLGILDTEALRPKLPPVICAVLLSFLFSSAPPHLTKWQANTDKTQLVD